VNRDGFLFQDNKDYPDDLMIEPSKFEECVRYLKDNQCRAVSFIHGEAGEDVGFLSECFWIECITINTPYLQNTEVINGLPKLKIASISPMNFEFCNEQTEVLLFSGSEKTRINKKCQNLVTVAANECKNANQILKDVSYCRNLRRLMLVKPSLKDLTMLDSSMNIEKLEIFYASQLTDIAGIMKIRQSLKELTFTNCKKILDFSILSELKELRNLVLDSCGKVQSLSFLREMPLMRDIRFMRTEIVDGDLSPCLGYHSVVCENKKNYNYSASDLTRH
jgi:hypothetical protein